MRTSGIWHAELVEVIVSMRHHDTLVIADAGLPVPGHVPTIDLGWCRRQPRFLPVLNAVVAELVVERATIASETTDDELFSARRRPSSPLLRPEPLEIGIRHE